MRPVCSPSIDIIDEPVLALMVSGLAAAVLGFVTSFLVLRGTDLTRLMVTLGVALILREVANQIPDLTGGADGLQGVVMGPILGLFSFDIFGHVGYIYCLSVLFVLFLLARRIVYSPFGLSLRSVKGNALRAASIGISVNGRLVAIYTFAAFYAGVAGALLTQTTSFASLDVFSFERSADLLLVLIIGGTGYLYGGLIGAVIFKLVQDWLADHRRRNTGSTGSACAGDDGAVRPGLWRDHRARDLRRAHRVRPVVLPVHDHHAARRLGYNTSIGASR